jgi:hypothetical protein
MRDVRPSRILPGRIPPGRFLPGAGQRRRYRPRATELVLALTAVALLAAGCLHLLAALAA